MVQKILTLAITVLCLALTVACGGGGDGAGDADDTAREITNDQLAQMVLALDQFGPEYAGFTADPDNTGVLDLAKASEDDFDPVAERADLEGAKFSTGQEAFFSGQPLEGGGAFFFGSSVGIFETADGADRYLQDEINEIPEEIGKTSEGITLKQMEPFDLAVGDEAKGVRGTSTFTRDDGSTGEYWFSAALFRRGRLIGILAIYAIGAGDLEKQRLEGKATSLASVMNERIASVLAATAPTAAPAAAGQ